MDPGRDLNLPPGFRLVPWPPRSREQDKGLAGGGEKNADVPKTSILYSNTRLPFGEWDVSRGVTQVDMPQGEIQSPSSGTRSMRAIRNERSI